MLKKLLKYEIKSTARLFLPLYVTLLVFAGINLLLFNLSNDTTSSMSFSAISLTISMIIYVTLMIGMIVLTLVVLIQRFYKNLLGDEGYLMFTLPVDVWKHILSKLSIAILWSILSIIVAMVSVLIIAIKEVSTTELIVQLSKGLQIIGEYFGTLTPLFWVEAFILLFISIAWGIMLIYAAIALGHLFNKHKLLASFGMYIALNTAEQILKSIAILTIGKGFFETLDSTVPTAFQVHFLMDISIVYYVITVAGLFFLTQYLLNKKLNLE